MQNAQFLPSDTTRKVVFGVLLIIMAVSQMGVFGAIGYLVDRSDTSQYLPLFRAGMTLMAVNFFLFLVFVIYYGLKFIRIVDAVIEDSVKNKVDQDSVGYTTLVLGVTKVIK